MLTIRLEEKLAAESEALFHGKLESLHEKVSDVPESRVRFASKKLTPCRMH